MLHTRSRRVRWQTDFCDVQVGSGTYARAAASQLALPQPLLSGTDLLAMGLAEGPFIGELLRRVREEQLEETITTKEEALELARHLLEERNPGKET